MKKTESKTNKMNALSFLKQAIRVKNHFLSSNFILYSFLFEAKGLTYWHFFCFSDNKCQPSCKEKQNTKNKCLHLWESQEQRYGYYLFPDCISRLKSGKQAYLGHKASNHTPLSSTFKFKESIQLDFIQKIKLVAINKKIQSGN